MATVINNTSKKLNHEPMLNYLVQGQYNYAVLACLLHGAIAAAVVHVNQASEDWEPNEYVEGGAGNSRLN